MSECSSFRLIGDPHVTKKFELNVPIHRRGEREELLFDDLKTRLSEGSEENVIVVGDLFEKPICSIQDLYRVMSLVLEAAGSQPNRDFLIMAGNHDRSSQKNRYGAFDILKLFDRKLDNLYIITSPFVHKKIALFPWEWDRTALDQLKDVQKGSFDVAVGHWDVVAYDENNVDHLCPAKELVSMGCEDIHSGHWHLPGVYKVDGIEVTCTGSMQPLNHSEDKDGDLYVTLSYEEYAEADPSTLKDKYVRVLAGADDGEINPPEDCLGFKINREAAKEDSVPVTLGNFDVEKIMKKNFDEYGVSEKTQKFIEDQLNVSD